ncbi:hypothetical protein EGW08_003131 [Elysia chlorotica]|uniref:Uncharacterized protein n=1 Tax=Elysia chlorotica TaxID=188477 RepID=A0A433U5N8_ELYCH|nr:hypothetical protein EGW08_003131 [Elysia chlorotica]
MCWCNDKVSSLFETSHDLIQRQSCTPHIPCFRKRRTVVDMEWSSLTSGLGRPVSTCGHVLSRFWLKVALLGWFATTSSLAELCIYKRTFYDEFTESYNKVLTTTSCPWGCCYKHSSPCCSAPMGLIVGCVLGGVLLVTLLIVIVCCCCVCRKRARNRAASSGASPAGMSTTSASGSRGMSVTFSSRTGDSEMGYPEPVVFHSESSRSVDYHMPAAYDPPPSYDEVMRGETNAAYKPESS